MKQDRDESLARFGVSRETEAGLRAYLDLLRRWGAKINLVAHAPAAELWQRHFVDSAQLLPLVPQGDGVLLDLGSGAGFPGLVLAATTGRQAHLIESDRRKATFLMEAARVMSLANVHIHATRIEQAAPPKAAVLTARALAPLPQLLALAVPKLAPGGVALFPKGRNAEEELTAAARDWTMRVERFPSATDPDATILRLSEISPAGAEA